MHYNSELAERICKEMGLNFNPEQNKVLINGECLPDDFNADKLFRGEYDEDRRENNEKR